MNSFLIGGKPIKFKSEPTKFSIVITGTALDNNPNQMAKPILLGEYQSYYSSDSNELIIEQLDSQGNTERYDEKVLFELFKRAIESLKISYSLDK